MKAGKAYYPKNDCIDKKINKAPGSSIVQINQTTGYSIFPDSADKVIIIKNQPDVTGYSKIINDKKNIDGSENENKFPQL